MQEQMERLRKIKTSCRVIRGFLWIMMGVMALFAVSYVWYGIKVAAAPESAFTAAENRFGGLSVDMAGQNFQVGASVPSYASPVGIRGAYSPKTLQMVNMGLGFVLVLVPFSAVIWEILRILGRVMAGESPFCTENIRAVKYVGFILLFLGLASKILYLLGITYLVFKGDVSGMSFLFDYLVAFTGGLLLVLARMFEYGSYLQSEYDATL